ncbi:hypothetical protein SAMN02745176_03219 [Lutispora thermophila DSM 19022]|jgi:hypothetical protein|uniref:Uncharacterized protein n=1 Tax=Lutispora thermophila DSM 19022 TaxID=1122184 RepID=A0A1M6IER9_9FIRM|nr:hypothetical protein SAMN02745176_03219 [Lutispora thermophila DSM 19022]
MMDTSRLKRKINPMPKDLEERLQTAYAANSLLLHNGNIMRCKVC